MERSCFSVANAVIFYFLGTFKKLIQRGTFSYIGNLQKPITSFFCLPFTPSPQGEKPSQKGLWPETAQWHLDPDPRTGIACTLKDTSKIQGKPRILVFGIFCNLLHLLGCRNDPLLSDDPIFPFPGAGWGERIQFWSSPYLDEERRKERHL